VLLGDARVRGALLLNVMSLAKIRRHPVESPAVWRSADVADTSGWTVNLNDDEREEIVVATGRALRAGMTPATLTREAFPVPAIGHHAREWAQTLATGRGFVLLRGFPQDRLAPEAAELAYIGLGLHLGTPVSQDAHGTLLGHVRDERAARTSPAVRLYRTRQRQDFHTDGADLVGLLCLRRARSGGESKIASSHAVYNEMLRRRPDLVEELYQPLPWDRNDEQSSGEPPYYLLPVFSDVDGAPRVFYIGWYITDAQRHAGAPRLTDTQREAMQLLQSIANDPTFHVTMDFQPGDVQLLNNAKILHAREAYEDDPHPSRRRHLLRLWLAAHEFTAVADTLRAGIPRRNR
jgi:hypothetical protein